MIKIPTTYYAEENINSLPSATVKIVAFDSSYSMEEKRIFQDAAQEWFASTDGIVQFIILYSPYNQSFLTDEKRFPENVEISLLKLEPLDPSNAFVIILDAQLHGEVVGYYDHSNQVVARILTVAERISSEQEYKLIIMHELGHAIGLQHNEARYTLMYKNIYLGSNCFTKSDAEEFCKLYNCENKNIKFCKPKKEETICLNEDF